MEADGGAAKNSMEADGSWGKETFLEEVQPDRMGYSRNLLHKYFISGKITLILRQPPDFVSYEVKNLGFTS